MLESGGGIDFRFPNGRGTISELVKDQQLKDGDKVTLGDVDLTVHHHPGHTKGATTFTYTTHEAGRTYNDVAIINMVSIKPGLQVRFVPGFPEIMKAYKTTLARQKELKPDVWVASHAPPFNIYDKYKAHDAYDPNRFVDPQGYQAKRAFYKKLVEANERKRAGSVAPQGRDATAPRHLRKCTRGVPRPTDGLLARIDAIPQI
jgi:metallo-beta-lactamase class B